MKDAGLDALVHCTCAQYKGYCVHCTVIIKYMNMKDAGLDALHSVIIRQKNMAQQIGVEIIQQNDIIDEIGQFNFYVAFI